jgi:hypothetical protein
MSLGLTAVGTQFYKNGRPFTGIGFNFWDAFVQELQSLGGGITTNYRTDLAEIKQTWGMPYISVSFGLYSQFSWYNHWYNNKATFYSKLDAFVAEAERVGLGLSVILIFNARALTDTCFNIYGQYEPVRNLAYPWTRSWKLCEEFVTEIVTRYKDSPSILCWQATGEMNVNTGVEYHPDWKMDGTTFSWINWGNSPNDTVRPITDKMTLRQWQDFSINLVTLIKKLDNHKRVVTSGCTIGNSFAVNAFKSATLATDTLADWQGDTLVSEGTPWVIYREKAYDTIHQHIYPQDLSNDQFYRNDNPERTAGELIALSKAWADSVNKPFYLGETGASYHPWLDEPVDGVSTNLETETAIFNEILNSIIVNNVSMSNFWNYSGDIPTGGEAWMKWDLNHPDRIYQLEALALANSKMNN